MEFKKFEVIPKKGKKFGLTDEWVAVKSD